MRIQYELTKDRDEALKKLMGESGIRTKRELLNNALTLFEWAINERKTGCMIASVNEKEGKFKEVIMPALTTVSSTIN